MKARLPKGMGKGPGDMNSMIRQAQKIQDDMAQAQEEINEREFSAKVGGGMVEVIMTGEKQVKDIIINKEVINPEEPEMLTDLLIAGINQVLSEIVNLTEETMNNISGGLNVPGV